MRTSCCHRSLLFALLVKQSSDYGRPRTDRFFVESSMLRVTIRSELKSALAHLAGKSEPRRTRNVPKLNRRIFSGFQHFEGAPQQR